MLTRKQQELLLFIHQRLREDGVAPSFDEMKDALELKSKSGIHRLIRALEERGFIRRLPHRARALEVVRLPEAMAGRRAAREPETADSGRIIQGNFRKPRRPELVKDQKPSGKAMGGAISGASSGTSGGGELDREFLQIPLHGKIAAGTPIEALQQETMIPVPAAMLGRGEHYALQVAGDSMIEAGILDGDTVIIRKTEAADNGDVVVALVDGIEATLKTLRKRGSQVALEPANRSLEVQIYPAHKVRVQGRLVGLLRRY